MTSTCSGSDKLVTGHLEHVPGLGGGDDDLIALLEQVDAAEGVAVGAPVPGDREVPELSELLGVGVVTAAAWSRTSDPVPSMMGMLLLVTPYHLGTTSIPMVSP